MKKYILLSIFAATLLAGCVKDELPAPTPPPPVEYNELFINELCTKDITDPYYVDAAGNGADWIEIFNNGNKAIDVGGLWVTDNPGSEADYIQIPTTDGAITTIPPKGFLVLICGATDAQEVDIPTSISGGNVFIAMGLSSSKENFAAIYDPNKSQIDISGDFNGLQDDKSAGLLTDGGDKWETLTNKTPGASNNSEPPVAGSLIINEFMCSNDIIPVPGDNGDFPDWIEIYNTGDTPIDMGGWYATDDTSDIVQYQLPTDDPALTTVPPKGFLILYCDGLGDGLHTNFKLSSGGEAIGISADGVTFSEGYTYCDTGCDLANPATNFSAGRNGDGNASWAIYDPDSSTPPTPMAPNGIQK
jgi:hypothetical protein